MALFPFVYPTFPEWAPSCKPELYLLCLNIVGHTCVLFKDISHEGGKEREMSRKRGMDGDIAKNGQWRVISKEKMEK